MNDQENLQRLDVDAYTVGWISALSLELAVATQLLDETHLAPSDFMQSQNPHIYTWGRMENHNVVMCSIEAGFYGASAAADVGARMASTFPNLKFGLLVGIGAGNPDVNEDGGVKNDIRLGDVAISQPSRVVGGVFQYDLVKLKPGDKIEANSFLNSPPRFLLAALTQIQIRHLTGPSKVPQILNSLSDFMKQPQSIRAGYSYQGSENDNLYDAAYTHTKGNDCRHCDPKRRVNRSARGENQVPQFHYGIIASGNSLIKDSRFREGIVQMIPGNCICFEMEAAGLMNSFPCLVIRGISDYADSHKNDRWQPYAAATAAAYSKELLSLIPPSEYKDARKIKDILQKS